MEVDVHNCMSRTMFYHSQTMLQGLGAAKPIKDILIFFQTIIGGIASKSVFVVCTHLNTCKSVYKSVYTIVNQCIIMCIHNFLSSLHTKCIPVYTFMYTHVHTCKSVYTCVYTTFCQVFIQNGVMYIKLSMLPGCCDVPEREI